MAAKDKKKEVEKKMSKDPKAKTAAKSASPAKKETAKKATPAKAAAKNAAPAKKETAVKKAAPAKKAAVAVKAAPAKTAAPVKKAAEKKAAPAKKAVPAKKEAAVKKETAVKKAAPAKKETAKKAETAKKETAEKKAAPAKKAEAVKKEPVKKAEPVKKETAKKAAPAKKEAEAVKKNTAEPAKNSAKKETAVKAEAKPAAKKNDNTKKGAAKKADKKADKKVTEEEDEFMLPEDDFDEEENDPNDPEAAALRETLFEEKLKSLISSAKKAGYMEYQEVIDTFTELNLDEEQFDRIWDALDKNHIVLRMEQIDDDDIPDEELAIEEGAELEYDMENLEAGVTDGANIEDPVRMYLKEIGRVPLLSAEEEIELAKRMELGMEAAEKNKDLNTKLAKLLESEKSDKKGKNAKSASEIAAKKAELKKKIAENDAKIASGKTAGQELSQANLRLVVSIAKRYVGRGMLFLDLIQEGNLGLIKAVEKFDYRKGYKFSTYATWWIRQAITRAIADQARTIRIPVHMVETINKIIRINRQLLQELGREPAPSEIAERMDMPEDRVREILKISQEPVSLETPIGEEEDSHLGDFIQDDNVPVPADAAAFTLLREQLNEILDTLTDRERKVLTLRFGLIDGRARTLEEVGKEFSVTRERIRQIEAKALRKLRHPSRSKRIKDFLD